MAKSSITKVDVSNSYFVVYIFSYIKVYLYSVVEFRVHSGQDDFLGQSQVFLKEH